MKNYSLSLLMLLTSFTLFAQPANDLCTGAETVLVDQAKAFNNTEATSDMDEITLNRDLWYLFTAPSSGVFDFSLCGSPFDTQIAVFGTDDCGSASLANRIGYNDDTPRCAFDDLNSIASVVCSAGNSYLVMVGGYSMEDFGMGQLMITSSTLEATPNDSCSSAIELSVNADLANCNPETLKMIGATETMGGNYCDDFPMTDIWFRFNTGNFVNIWPRIYASEFDQVLEGGVGYLFTFYNNCQEINIPLSEQCDVDTIFGFEKNTDYFLKFSNDGLDGFDLEMCLIGVEPVGLKEVEDLSFTLFPNPAHNEVHISLQENDQYQVELLDLSGRSLLQSSFDGNEHDLQLDQVDPGVYLVQISGTNKQYSERITVQ